MHHIIYEEINLLIWPGFRGYVWVLFRWCGPDICMTCLKFSCCCWKRFFIP